MHIRPLQKGDYSAVRALFVETFTMPLGDLHISWSGRSKKDSIGIFLRADSTAGSEAEALIGFMIASFSRSSGTSMYVDYFAIAKEYRGSGLGTKLLLDLVTECYDMRGSLHLYPERDDIVPWYERNGFRETRGGYYVFHSYNTRMQGGIHRRMGLC